MATEAERLAPLVQEFARWIAENGFTSHDGDAADILALQRVTSAQRAWLENFSRRWDAAQSPADEVWHAERSPAGDAWNVLDENRLRVATVHRAGASAARDAHLLAAAPQLAKQLAAVLDWMETNAIGAPRALWEDAAQALQDAKGSL